MATKDTSLKTNLPYVKNIEDAKLFYSKGEEFSSGTSRSRDRYVTPKKIDESRPEYAVPTYGRYQEQQHLVMDACNLAYKRNSLVRSVVDLISEWATDGIKIVSSDPKQQELFDAWSARVKTATVSEQFCRWLAKSGNVVVRRRWGTSRRKRIPVSYVFYDPATIELVGDFAGTIADRKTYAIKIPIYNFVNRTYKYNDEEKKVFESLPKEIKDAINGNFSQGTTYYEPIPERDIYVGWYKKDDSEIWANSFVYTVLPYVIYNEKLHRAKMSLLDGMMNPIRIWGLGDIVEGAIPSPDLGKNLENIVSNHTEGPVDIIWDNLIKLQVEYPPIEKIKDMVDQDEKILYGLGIQIFGKEVIKESAPIAIKDLVKRVEYIRGQLKEFWMSEIRYFCDGLGIEDYPELEFRYADFYSEQTYMNFVLELLDRNVISDERILEIIKENPVIEKARVNRQEALRSKEQLPQKASPYHNPAQLTMDKFKEEEIKQQEQNYNNVSKQKLGDSKPGRPAGATDSTPRQRTRGELTANANLILEQVESFVEQKYLEKVDKKDLRSLTNKEKEEVFNYKAFVFASINPEEEFKELTEPIIEACIEKADLLKIQNFWEIYEQMITGAGIKLTNSIKDNALVTAYVKIYENL